MRGNDEIEDSILADIENASPYGIPADWIRERRAKRTIPVRDENVDRTRLVVADDQVGQPVLVEITCGRDAGSAQGYRNRRPESTVALPWQDGHPVRGWYRNVRDAVSGEIRHDDPTAVPSTREGSLELKRSVAFAEKHRDHS